VIIASYAGMPVANIAALVTPAGAVVSIWRFSNSTKLFQAGYFADPSAPVDFATMGSIDRSGAPRSGDAARPGRQHHRDLLCLHQPGGDHDDTLRGRVRMEAENAFTSPPGTRRIPSARDTSLPGPACTSYGQSGPAASRLG